MTRQLHFIVAGVQKAGTTTIFDYLRQRPDLSVPRRKELHFFDDETVNWEAPDYSRLDAWFEPDDAGRPRFDVTPIYTFWPAAMARIRAHSPDAKIIVLFRDPIERAWSHWCMEFARGNDPLPFENAIRQGRRRLENNSLPRRWRLYSYVERGLYADQVRRLLDSFPRQRCLFVPFDALVRDHMPVLNKITDFVGITRFPQIEAVHSRPRLEAPYPSVLRQEDVDYLADLFQGDVEEFAGLTGIDVSNWLTVTRRLPPTP